MIWWLNRILNGLFDLMMWPCQGGSPWTGLILSSLFIALFLLAVFSVLTDPSAILLARNRLVARTLELLLFQHDLRICCTACGRIVVANFVYLGRYLLPVLVSSVPLLIIFAQLECWFQSRPLRIGEQTVLTAKIDKTYPVNDVIVDLKLSENLRLDSAPVRVRADNEIAWRVLAVAPGDGWGEVIVAEATQRKSVSTGNEFLRVSPNRNSRGIFSELLAPSEKPLDDSCPIRSLSVVYPRREISIGRTEISWLTALLVLTLLFSLFLGWVLGVRIA